MRQKRNPAPVELTGSGAKTKKAEVTIAFWPGISKGIATGCNPWRPFPPVVTGSELWRESFLTSCRKADNLSVLTRKRCVDLHLKPGLFLLHPAIEFASSVQVSARPWELFTALGTLGAFLFGGIHHE